MPDDLRDALRDVEGASAALEGMPLEYRRWAFLFIEQAGNDSTRNARISNLVGVAKNLR
jgi:hypothetical protein